MHPHLPQQCPSTLFKIDRIIIVDSLLLVAIIRQLSYYIYYQFPHNCTNMADVCSFLEESSSTL